jgi:thiamine biosynthesis lipoprotein
VRLLLRESLLAPPSEYDGDATASFAYQAALGNTGIRSSPTVLDPRTGWSADPVWRTVSVAAQTCLAANTVSTAAIIRGWRALDWIRALGIPARLVDSERNVHTICGWPRDGTGARR